MHNLQFGAFSMFALLMGPWLFLRAFRDLRVRRLIENTPTAHIRSMAMGLVEINGEVIPRSEHQAPFSARPCAYWEIDISTRTRNNGWNVVHRSSSGSPFFIRDETGIALVYPKGSDCRVQSQVEETCLGINVPACYLEYMDAERLAFRHVWRLSTLRFRERILEEGQAVFMLGTAVPRPNAMSVSMDDEIQATGTDGPHERRIHSLQSEVAAIVRRDDHHDVFIISQESERQMTSLLGMKAWAGMLAGPALTLMGLAYWLNILTNRH